MLVQRYHQRVPRVLLSSFSDFGTCKFVHLAIVSPMILRACVFRNGLSKGCFWRPRELFLKSHHRHLFRGVSDGFFLSIRNFRTSPSNCFLDLENLYHKQGMFYIVFANLSNRRVNTLFYCDHSVFYRWDKYQA